MNGSIIYIAALLAGVGLQFLSRWSPFKNLGLSFLILAMLPYAFGFGMVCGIWVGCAFIPYNTSANHPKRPLNPKRAWREVFIYSLWTFSGFLMALVFLFKIKLAGGMQPPQMEALTWVFFGIIELCLFRIIACAAPSWFRLTLGYRMSFLNFLLVLYWVIPYGWFAVVLTFLTLMASFPLVLSLMSFAHHDSDVVMGGSR